MADNETWLGWMGEAGRRFASWFQDWYARNSFSLRISALAGLLALAYIMPSVWVPIYPGQSGVLWRRFFGGTDTKYVLGEGINLKWPWDRAYIYDVRLQTETGAFNVLTEDGLTMEVQVTARFRPNPKYLGVLHKNVGPDYVQKLLIPEVGAHGREEMSKLRPEELYTQKRQLVQQGILEKLRQTLNVKYLPDMPGEDLLYLQDVLIRNITLPALVAEAIQEKNVQKQKLLEYEYRLKKEEQEKERKRIEGEGIQLFQNMVSQGISEQFLKWKGINATMELANSNNSKIVIIGAGKAGLPIILGNLEGAQPPPPAGKTARGPDEGEISNTSPEVQTREPEWSMDKP